MFQFTTPSFEYNATEKEDVMSFAASGLLREP